MKKQSIVIGLLASTFVLSSATQLMEPSTVQAATQATYKQSNTSQLGQLKSQKSRIYTAPGSKKSVVASTKYTNEIFYISKVATKTGDETYYQVSRHADPKKAALGWVKSKSITRKSYKVMTNTKKTRYIKGTGTGYTRPGGLARNVIFPSMAPYKHKTFLNAETVKVGTATWYRGTVNNQTTWLPATSLSDQKLTTATEKPAVTKVSLIAQLNDKNTILQTDLTNDKTKQTAGAKAPHTYVVKEQASYKKKVYYNLGVIGWVEKDAVKTHPYGVESTLNQKAYLTGGGYGYTMPWGAADDIVTKTLTKGKPFTISKQVKIGTALWYYGKTEDNKQMWVLSSRTTTTNPTPEPTPPPVEAPIYQKISKQGTIKSTAVLYTDLVKQTTRTWTTAEKTEKFTMNRSAKLGNTTYYELSRLSTAGKDTVVGWVKSTELTSANVQAPTASSEVLYLTGLGNATTVAGATNASNIRFKDLKSYPATKFTATKQQVINDTTYYLGKIGSKFAWVRADYFGNPYQYMNLRKVSNITQAEMEQFLVNVKGTTIKNNNLYKAIPVFLDMQKRYGINAQFMLAHAIVETGWGSSKISQYKNNFFGYQAYDKCAMSCALYFPTGNDGVQYYADAIYRKYLRAGAIYNNGPSAAGMNVKYASDKSWATSIGRIMGNMKPYDATYYDKAKVSALDPTQPVFNYTNVIPAGKPLPPTYQFFDAGITATMTKFTTVRLLPSEYGKVLMNYNIGTKVTIDGTNDDVASTWMRVKIQGQEAWVLKSDLQFTNLARTITEANVRNDASTTGTKVIKVLDEGKFVKLVQDTSGKIVTKKDAKGTVWHQVYVPTTKTTGWISSTILKVQ